MKNSLTYIGSLALTLLLIVCCIGTTAACIAKCRALNPAYSIRLAEKNGLCDKVHDHLASYYSEQANVSGIPAEVYAESISAEALKPIMDAALQNGFDFLNGKTEEIGFSHDYTKLEASLTAFFEQYAADNGYERDEAFDKTLASAIKAAEHNITEACDVYRFSLLNEAGMLTKVRKAIPYVNVLLWACVGAAVFLIAALVLLYRKELRTVLYWIATALLVSSVLMLIPTAFLQGDRWFDRFAVKADHIFAAVTGFLYSITGTVIGVSVAGIVLAALLYGGFAWLSHKAKKTAASNA